MKKGGSFLAAFLLPIVLWALPMPELTVREGSLDILVEDDFANSASRDEYTIVTDTGERLQLQFAGSPPSGWKTGDRVRVTGQFGSGVFVVETAERVSTVGPERISLAESSWTTGPKRVLLIRFNFADDTSQPYSDVTAQSVMFGATGSVAAFYVEGSYGLTTHAGNITPWLTVASNKPTTCDPFTPASKADTLAKSAGYDPYTYDLRVYVFPGISSCGWSGLGSVGGPGAWINQALSTYVVAHELGHNYGLMHAHSLDCGATSFGPSCTRSEYGDPFDTMGGSLRQFNAYAKSSLAWLPAASIETQSSGNATHTLSPLEGAAGTRAIQIPTSYNRTYWVEFRQAIGFDAGLSSNTNVMNGALVHIAPSPVSGTDLLDMTPATSTFGDAALDVGQSFVDSVANVSITTLSKAGATLSVQVQFGVLPPTGAFSFAPTSPIAGHGVSFQDQSTGLPSSWAWSFGDGTTSSLQSPVHSYATAGNYNVTLTVSNGAGSAAPVSHTVTVAADSALRFYTVTPCRVVDTRNTFGSYGGPALFAKTTRNFTLTGRCGVPSSAKAVSVNVTVTGATSGGNLRVSAVGSSDMGASTINFRKAQTRANSAVLELGSLGNLAVQCGILSGSVHFILDVNGYLQ